MAGGEAVGTFAQIQEMTGITKSNNYFKTRKQLVNSGYLIVDESGMRVNADKLLSDYSLLTNRKYMV